MHPSATLEFDSPSEDAQRVQREILVEYLKLLRSEMHLRIEKNYTLVSLKLMSLAAATSFAIGNFEKVPGFEWLAYLLIPLIGIMFDLHIGYNLKWMNTTGTFIRDKIEKFFEKHYEIVLYETHALGFNAYQMRVVDALCTGFVVSLGSIGFCQQSPFNISSKVAAVVALLLLYCASTALLLDTVKGHQFESVCTNREN